MTKKKSNVWVSPRDDKWIVHRENSSRPSDVTSTQAEANEIARRIAQNEKVDRITQGRVLSSIFRTFRNHVVGNPPNAACSSTFSDPTQTARCI